MSCTMARVMAKSTGAISKAPMRASPLAETNRAPGDMPPIAGTDKLDKILNVIEHTRDHLEFKIEEVTVGLTLLRDDHRKLTDKSGTEGMINRGIPTSGERAPQPVARSYGPHPLPGGEGRRC